MARYEYAPRHVIEARYLGDYKVWLEFNDGRKGVVDLADELHGDELEPLRDRDRFAQFYLDYGLASIAWLDGQDFAPEFLYEQAEGNELVTRPIDRLAAATGWRTAARVKIRFCPNIRKSFGDTRC